MGDETKTVAERLVSIEEQLKYLTRRLDERLGDLNKRLDEEIMTQVRDHGKRIAALESRQVWIGGWVAGAGAIGALIVWLLEKVN